MSTYNKTIHLPAESSRLIGMDQPTYIIAEIGTNHAGSLSTAKKQIKAASDAGADAVKFQLFHAEEFVSDKSLTYTYKDHQEQEHTVSQLEMFRELELPEEWIPELLAKAQEEDVDWFASVADERSLTLALEHGAPVVKLASEDLINVELLRAVRGIDVPVLLSRGMGNRREIKNALSILSPEHNPDLILLHCISAYPASADQLNLRQIHSLQDEFSCLVGYSDHSQGSEAAGLAVALGACIIEKHFTTDPSLFGPDQALSSPPEEFSQMVSIIRRTKEMLGQADIGPAKCEEENRVDFRRGIVASKTIPAGKTITRDDLAYKRPAIGLKPYEQENIIGKQASREIQADEPITTEEVQE